jgi:hypothetical protein
MKIHWAILELLHEDKLREKKIEIRPAFFFFVSFGCECAQNVFTVNVYFCLLLLTKRKAASMCVAFVSPASYHTVPLPNKYKFYDYATAILLTTIL